MATLSGAVGLQVATLSGECNLPSNFLEYYKRCRGCIGISYLVAALSAFFLLTSSKLIFLLAYSIGIFFTAERRVRYYMLAILGVLTLAGHTIPGHGSPLIIAAYIAKNILIEALLGYVGYHAFIVNKKDLLIAPTISWRTIRIILIYLLILIGVSFGAIMLIRSLIDAPRTFISRSDMSNYTHNGVKGKQIDGIGITLQEIFGHSTTLDPGNERDDRVTICNMRSTPIKASVSGNDLYWSMHDTKGRRFTGTATYSGLGGTDLNPGMCMHTTLTFKVPSSLDQKYVTLSVSGTKFYMPIHHK